MTKSSLTRTLSLLGAAALLTIGFAGCKSSSDNAANTAAVNNGIAPAGTNADPADANLAPASGTTQVLGANSSYTPRQQGESYQQQAPAPIVQGYNNQDQGDEYAGEDAVDYSDQAPPPLPEYDQPPAPDPNYIWTPGYWGWSDGGYYWVPGAWCPPPYYGALWTPPYWGYYNGRYGFHRGYWGPHVGYYGGVDYGYGYIGIGYFGGYWQGNDFYYNRAVTNVGRGGYTYDHPVVYNNVHYNGRIQNRVSYNGGQGGLTVRPRPSEMAALHENHAAPLPEQRQVAQDAARNKQQFYTANHGRPANFARAQPVGSTHSIAAPPAAVVRDQQHANQIRATEAQHPNTPQQRGAPAMEQRGAPATQQHGAPAMEQRGAPATQQHGVTEQRGALAVQQHNMPQRNMQEQRTAPASQQHAMPERRTAPAPQERAMPQQRATPQQRAMPEQRAVPQQRSAPAPQQRMAPAPQQRSAPAPRPAPEQRPAPQQHSAPAQRPAPQARPAPQSRPAPAQHPEPQHEERPH